MSDIIIQEEEDSFESVPQIDYFDQEVQAGRMTSKTIHEYIVIVYLPEDWEEVHEYIINENEIDGIPNRKINCSNEQQFSLRSAIYEMSKEEADILRTHSQVEYVDLNPEKYPQPAMSCTKRYKKDVAFHRPIFPGAYYNPSTGLTNGIRANWGNITMNNASSKPFQGVGIGTTDTTNQDLFFSVTGKNVDAVVLDGGIGILHPEFIADDGTYRVHDIILDGPYKVDPDAFDGYTETITIDSVEIGTRAQEARAREWWSNTNIRSSEFQSLGTITISANYTRILAHTKNGHNSIVRGHGTAVGSQIAGKSFGVAFECNIWNLRIYLEDYSPIQSSVGLDACTIFHKAKKIASNDPDPTLLCNSWGTGASTGNTDGVSYNHHYRGNNLTYTGTGITTDIPANSGACRNIKAWTMRNNTGTIVVNKSSSGGYVGNNAPSSSSAESAIAAGCIVTAAAMNQNQKLSDKNDVDFNNWYNTSSNYINRASGVQKGFSGDHDIGKGTIRVGALDCAVEPDDEKQGATKFSLRKVHYSNNGPMIDLFAPAEMTMSAAYASYEGSDSVAREDDPNFKDFFFNGTSAACPITCSVIALYLQSNRRADQDAVRYWLNTSASKDNLMSDPISGINSEGYWSSPTWYGASDLPSKANQSYNVRGSGNLRGAPNKVLFNPYGHDTSESDYEDKVPSFSGSFSITGSFSIINN